MTLVWTNYVALRDQILPEARRGSRLRTDVTLAVGVGADGGWELEKAREPMAEAARLRLRCCYSLATLATYRGHNAQSWYDEREWLKIAVNVRRIIDAARAAKHKLLCIDLEPYLGDASSYPAWPRVGDVTSQVAEAAAAMRPMLVTLTLWPHRLAVAPGGLEYGVVPLILARRAHKALWLDEWALFARTAADMDAALRHLDSRKRAADAIGVPFAAGWKWPLLADAEAARRAFGWAKENECDCWLHGELDDAAITWLFGE